MFPLPPRVTCHVSCVMCQVSCLKCHMYFFFMDKFPGASRWSVCYQRGLPRLVKHSLTYNLGSKLREPLKLPKLIPKHCFHDVPMLQVFIFILLEIHVAEILIMLFLRYLYVYLQPAFSYLVLMT